MDGVDTLLASAKMLKYLRYDTMCDAMFGLFVIASGLFWDTAFITTSHGQLLLMRQIVAAACQYMAENGQKICFNPHIHRGFVALLIALQIITLIWLYMIVRVIVKIVKGGGAEDSRSDDEDDDEEGEAGNFHDEDTNEKLSSSSPEPDS